MSSGWDYIKKAREVQPHDLEKILRYYDHAKNLDPNYYLVYKDKARLFFVLGEHEKSKENYQIWKKLVVKSKVGRDEADRIEKEWKSRERMSYYNIYPWERLNEFIERKKDLLEEAEKIKDELIILQRKKKIVNLKHVRKKLPQKEPVSKPSKKDSSRSIESDSIGDLAKQMLKEHVTNGRTINKALQQSLTKEFLNTRSIKAVIANHPEISNMEIKRHVRTPLRLPDDLRTLNEGSLHPDPQISLQIALFAVNHHNWDGSNDDAKNVLQTAESIANHIIATDTDSDTSTGESFRSRQKNTNPPAEPVSTAVAVWIAAATMHKEHGMNAVFSARDLVSKVKEQNLCNVSHGSIQTHVSSHCVANVSTTHKNDHRKIYRVAPGIYRLYKRGEYYHPTREGFKIAPLPFQIPSEYRDLRRWYDEEYCAQP